MNWQNRVRESCTLTAPDNTQFTALWRGNDISAQKLVGRFTHPNAVGATTQDMGADARDFPLTLIFEGDDHDLTARAFQRAFLTQRGPWTVVHPVEGTLTLQGVSISLGVDPVGSGNQTIATTAWIETSLPDDSVSASDLSQRVSDAVDAVNVSAAAQFTATIDVASTNAQAAISGTGLQSLGVFDVSSLSTLAQKAADVQAAVNDAYSKVQAAFTMPMDLTTAVAQVQALIELPALVGTGLSSKLTSFGTFLTGMFDALTGGSDTKAVNGAATSELYLTAALAGQALAVTVTQPSTREEALQAIALLRSSFLSVTSALDAVQSRTSGNYFSMSGCFIDLSRMTAAAIAYLLRIIFDLRIAKHITLTRPRTPLSVTIAEYGAEYASDGSSYLDLFLASNAIRGANVRLLPAGWEGVVYV